MKRRSRRCGAPASAALTQSHSASYPSAATVPRTSDSAAPPLTVRRPGTFSRSTQSGSTSPRMRAMLGQIHRSSLVPWRLPAVLAGWQGKPAVTTSTFPRHGRPSKVLTSSQIGASCREPSWKRAARRAAAKGSRSTQQTVRRRGPTARRRPSSRPPPPLQRLRPKRGRGARPCKVALRAATARAAHGASGLYRKARGPWGPGEGVSRTGGRGGSGDRTSRGGAPRRP